MNVAKAPIQDEHHTKGSKKSKKPKRNISAFHIFSKEVAAALLSWTSNINK